MKLEIDTINKTIKVLDECTWEDISDMICQLPEYREYKFIPNTIINTIKIRDIYDPWVKPYTQPWTIQPSPYTNPYPVYCTNENTTLSNNIKN